MKQRPITYLAKSSPFERIIIGGIGLVVVGLLWILAGKLTTEHANQIALFSAFVSGLLTFSLVWIYLKIAEETIQQTNLQKQVTDVQKQQADSMERQEKMMEFQYLPRIRIRDFELLPDNKIRLKLVNVGNGLAEKMFLRTALFVRPEQNSVASYSLDGETFSLDNKDVTLCPGYTPLARNEDGIVSSDLLGESLRPDESEIAFKSRTQVGVDLVNEDSDERASIPLQPILDKIYEKGYSDVYIELSLVYSDIKNDIQTEYILGRTVNLEVGDRELKKMINTDYVTYWSPTDDEERLEIIRKSNIYPPI